MHGFWGRLNLCLMHIRFPHSIIYSSELFILSISLINHKLNSFWKKLLGTSHYLEDNYDLIYLNNNIILLPLYQIKLIFAIGFICIVLFSFMDTDIDNDAWLLEKIKFLFDVSLSLLIYNMLEWIICLTYLIDRLHTDRFMHHLQRNH